MKISFSNEGGKKDISRQTKAEIIFFISRPMLKEILKRIWKWKGKYVDIYINIISNNTNVTLDLKYLWS